MREKKSDFKFKRVFILVAVIMFVSAFVLYAGVLIGFHDYNFNPPNIHLPIISPAPQAVEAFASAEDFKNYIQSGQEMKNVGYSGGITGGRMMVENAPMATPSPANSQALDNSSAKSAEGTPDRISQTNVQTIGVDEPDIVKTNGTEIYFSPDNVWIKPMPVQMMKTGGISFEVQSRIMPPVPLPEGGVNIIKAFPPADLASLSKIDKRGNLLLYKNILMIFSGQEITGYDVADPKNPEKKWSIKLGDTASLVTSRLYGDQVYLITQNVINDSYPCPYQPLSVNDSPVSIDCREIYHPVAPIPVDNTFTAMSVNPANGQVEKTVSFVGVAYSSVIYVSTDAIYIAYPYSESVIKFFIGFLKENQSVFPAWLTAKVEKLDGYDISESSKISEFMLGLQKYTNSLSADDRLKVNADLQNRMSDYYANHKRDLEKTGIVKIDLAGFRIAANGSVPGHLLNNFSLDEYRDNLRIATTIGSRWGILGGIGTGGTTNDVYVLDKNLNLEGSVKDFGQSEQIYSVRFVEDAGYVVTFRQTDPFFVMDLSDPANPQMKGELKIPGYSSYLHPLDATHVLGIGQENWQVKISLFDVSNKNNPVELDKYLLDENWTEVSSNYHAFLLDDKHKVFFLPGGKGGYVFSYTVPSVCLVNANCRFAPAKIWLQKAVSQISAKRALYLNDYLYIIGDNKITALNEADWQKVNEFDLSQ